MIFEGCKGAKIAKTDKSTQHTRFNLLFCYFRDSKSVSLFITNKKKREKTQKITYFLPKYFADTENCRTFASQSRNNEITSKQRILLYLYCGQPPAMLRRCQRWRGEMTAKLTCPLCTQPTALAKMQACKVSEYKQKAINCISQKTE